MGASLVVIIFLEEYADKEKHVSGFIGAFVFGTKRHLVEGTKNDAKDKLYLRFAFV